MQRTSVDVTNQFGTFQFDTKKTVALMVPTARTFVGNPPPTAPPGPPVTVDHYRCVAVKYSVGSQILPTSLSVSVVDDCGTRTLAHLVPRALCIATDKNNEGIFTPSEHLLCYKMKMTGTTSCPGLQIFDQFGPGLIKLKGEREFCVPSTVTP